MANNRTFWTYPSGTQGLISEALVVDAHVYALATNGPSDGLTMLATPPCPPASLRFTPAPQHGRHTGEGALVLTMRTGFLTPLRKSP